MPRATRSKKIVFLEDVTATASQIALPDISSEAGAPLAEISSNQEENEIVEAMTVEDVEIAEQLKGLKAAYKTAIGLKKNKKGRNKKKEKLQLDPCLGNKQEVIDDQQPAAVSPASEGARQLLNFNEDGTQSIEAEEYTTPPSPAVRATQQLVKQQAGQFDIMISLAGTNLDPLDQYLECMGSSSAIHSHLYSPPIKIRKGLGHRIFLGRSKTDTSKLLVELEGPSQEAKTLSKVFDKFAHLENKSPMKAGITTFEEVEREFEENGVATPKDTDAEEDSFIEKITERSPAKPVSRIEDSIEELDRLEDTIEALDQVTITKPIPLPEKQKRGLASAATVPRGRSRKAMNGTVNASMRAKPQEAKAGAKAAVAPPKAADNMKTKSTQASRESVTIDSAENKGATTRKLSKRPASPSPPKEPVRSTKPVTLPNFELPGEAVARKLKEQREARRAQSEDSPITKAAPPPVPKVKSTKPPTKSTFELPGEALSRKKRKVHEARLKAQEEEERKRREFKAKPLRKSVAPDFVPRDTAASLARKSQVVNPENALAMTGLPYSNLSLKVAKRGSIVGAHRPSILATNIANTSAPRSPGPNHARNASTSGTSMSGLTTQRAVSTLEVRTQRQRAKEIYNRDMKALGDLEKERRDREAAAKKSREEAAERGRQASREWAEKQRAKKATQADKGLSAGFGPGGQLGLKA